MKAPKVLMPSSDYQIRIHV